jgi:hypothetical protein
MGNYAHELPPAVLQKDLDTAPVPAIANMHLKRYVSSSEPKKNCFANSTIKQISGGSILNVKPRLLPVTKRIKNFI